MSANLENSAVAIRLENISFHSNPKERQGQRMFKLPHNCTNLTCQQSNAQNSPSQAQQRWTVNFQIFKLDSEKAVEPETKLLISTGSSKKGVPEKHPLLLYWLYESLCVDHIKLWKILKEMGLPNHLTSLLRNLYSDQEATVRTRHGKMH